MKLFRTIATLFVPLLPILLLTASYGQQSPSPAYASAARKFAWIGENGRKANPSSQPTVLTAAEWNAYLNEGGVKLPEGVSKVTITTQHGVVHGDAEIDFDRLTASRTRSNPFLELFTGRHHVTVTAQASAVNGIGTVHIETVAFDGVEVPRIALEYFVSRYLRPKFGNAVDLDSTFHLHSRIDTAIIDTNNVTITQR